MRAFFFARARKAVGAVVACGLAAALTMGTFAVPAFAEVRNADIVLGQTVESRGLTVANSPNIVASYALLMDEDGTVYFERDADTESKIASITKVMTAIVALDDAPDATVTVSAEAASVGESSAQLIEGDTMSMSDAVKALLVMSGNDAAQAIAETVGAQRLSSQGGDTSDSEACVQAFIDRMNEKASELGLENSVFRNPHGLDDGSWEGDHHSTARDVATMVRYAMQNETFRNSVNSATDVITVERDGEETTLELESTDQLLGVYEGACGVKTGFTDAAGYCFAGAANRGDGDLYTVVLGSTEDPQRFDDTTALFDWYYEHRIDYPLAHAPRTATMQSADGSTEEVPVVAEVSLASWVDRTVPATLDDPDATVQVFDLNGNISQEATFDTVSGAVRAGDKVGTLTFKQHNEVVAEVDMVAVEDVAAPSFFEGIGIWWDRFFRSFSGAQSQAESVLLNDTPLIVDKTSATSL